MVSINTNLSSLTALNSLNQSTNALNTAIERLTTGYKINHASDNAANYSIVQNMTSQLNSYMVAEENASMGLDLLQTAEENLNLVQNHLTRIRDLAEQAANGTYGSQSLQAIQSEVDARMSEINRIVSSTEYNDIMLFGEETSKFTKPVERLSEEEAIEQGYTIIKTEEDFLAIKNNLSGKYMLMNNIDFDGIEFKGLLFSGMFSGELNGNGYIIKNFQSNGSQSSIFWTLTGTIKNLGMEDVVLNASMFGSPLAMSMVSGSIENCYVAGNMSGNPSVAGGLVAVMGGGSTIKDCWSDINISGSGIGAGGIVGSTQGDNNQIINSYSKGDISSNSAPVGGIIGNATTNPTITDCYYTGTVVKNGVIVEDPLYREPEAEESSNGTIFQVGINVNSSSQINVDTSFVFDLNINVCSQNLALRSLFKIDKCLNAISAKQTEFGAAENRLESTLESIGVSIENLTSSRSTLQDADVAKVSSEYIKHQILQQASATLLATANQSPTIALRLLGAL